MSKTKITYIVSDIDKALAFEWVAETLDASRFELEFILLNPGDSQLETFLKQQGVQVKRLPCAGKKDWPKAGWTLYRHLKKTRPDIVHCHLIQANILGLSAAKMAGIPKRIYTRHHSSLHHDFHPKGVWWDKACNRLATDIIAISPAVHTILKDWEAVPENKITDVPHGFKLSLFDDVSEERIGRFKAKNELSSEEYIVGVVSRFTEWKGVQYIIPAFEKFLKVQPNAVLVLLNARGDYQKEIETLLRTLPESRYRCIAFEPDVAAAFKSMEVFVHVPIDAYSEAFGQIYVEALVAAVPSIFTLSGIAPEFVKHEENALVVPFKNSEAIADALSRLQTDHALVEKLKIHAPASVKDQYDLSKMMERLTKLYSSS